MDILAIWLYLKIYFFKITTIIKNENMNNKYTLSSILDLIDKNKDIDRNNFHAYIWWTNKEINEIIGIVYNQDSKEDFAKILQYLYIYLSEVYKIKLIKIIKLDRDFFFFTYEEIKKHTSMTSWMPLAIAKINWHPDRILYEKNVWNFYFNEKNISSEGKNINVSTWNKIKYLPNSSTIIYNGVSYSIVGIKELIKFMDFAYSQKGKWLEKEELKKVRIDINKLKDCLRKTFENRLGTDVTYKLIFPHFKEKGKEYITIIG